jgi:murein DD-endopeptidase MepM/ murein hydrolase activator NlpD
MAPAAPQQGDFVVVRVAEPDASAVAVWFGGVSVPVAAVRGGWQATFGIDLAAKPGARAVTGETQKGGQREAWKLAFRLRDAGFPEQRMTLEDDTKVHLAAADVARAERERQDVLAVLRGRTGRAWSGSFVHPLDAKPQGGRFGSRRIINNEPRNPHTGADYGIAAGTPVHAANAGVVVLTADHFFSGNSIFIDHGDGLFTMYFHLEKSYVTRGQPVKKGDIIGTVGATGRASGPHLHFGVNYRGARVNPASLLSQPLE